MAQQRLLNLQFQFENNKLSTSIKSYARKAGRLRLSCRAVSLGLPLPLPFSVLFFGRTLGPVYSYLIYARHDQATLVAAAIAIAIGFIMPRQSLLKNGRAMAEPNALRRIISTASPRGESAPPSATPLNCLYCCTYLCWQQGITSRRGEGWPQFSYFLIC